MLQVSTADILVIWKFEINRNKIPLFARGREVSFAFSYRGPHEFEGLRDQGMPQHYCGFNINGKFLVY